MREEAARFSERLGVLTRAQLQAALDRFSLGKLLDARAPEGGMFGQNVFLRTESAEWVFRGAPHVYQWKPHPTWQFSKERWFAERIAAQTRVPAPWPYLVETSPEIFGWAFALMPRLPGEQGRLAKQSLGVDDRIAIARTMGETLAELHALRWPLPGDYDPALDDIRPDASLRDYALRVVADCRQRAAIHPTTLEPEDHAFIDQVIREAEGPLAVPAETVCIHLDFHHGNLNVARDVRHWKVSGVFDLMSCEFGDGEMDLSRSLGVFMLEDPALADPFVDGYRARRPLRPGARERFRLFMLIDRLILWSFGKRTQDWFGPDDRFRTWCSWYLEKMPAAFR